jgi:hypothetical protein
MTDPGGAAQFTPDEAVAAQMAQMAKNFVAGLAEDGIELDYDASWANRLDEICDAYLASGPSPDGVRLMAIAMGAYLGELLVREGAGVWVSASTARTKAGQQESVAVLLTSGLAAFPLTKVNKRLTVGSEHSLQQFFEVSKAGQLPPGTRPMDE